MNRFRLSLLTWTSMDNFTLPLSVIMFGIPWGFRILPLVMVGRLWYSRVLVRVWGKKRDVNGAPSVRVYPIEYAYTGIIVGMGSANESWRYIVMSSLFGWAHTHNDHSGCGLNQWEPMLHCNIVSHWLSPYWMIPNTVLLCFVLLWCHYQFLVVSCGSFFKVAPLVPMK